MAQILIIEDDAASADLIHRILAPERHSVTFAENGAVALAILARSPFDLVITDLLMPVVEGLETIRQIRSIDPDVKIIALSGVHSRYLEAASKFGANAVFRKPLQPSELRGTVAKLLSESGGRDTAPASTSA